MQHAHIHVLYGFLEPTLVIRRQVCKPQIGAVEMCVIYVTGAENGEGATVHDEGVKMHVKNTDSLCVTLPIPPPCIS